MPHPHETSTPYTSRRSGRYSSGYQPAQLSNVYTYRETAFPHCSVSAILAHASEAQYLDGGQRPDCSRRGVRRSYGVPRADLRGRWHAPHLVCCNGEFNPQGALTALAVPAGWWCSSYFFCKLSSVRRMQRQFPRQPSMKTLVERDPLSPCLSLLVRYQYIFSPVNLVAMLPFRAPADVVCAIASGHGDPAPMCSLYYF